MKMIKLLKPKDFDSVNFKYKTAYECSFGNYLETLQRTLTLSTLYHINSNFDLKNCKKHEIDSFSNRSIKDVLNENKEIKANYISDYVLLTMVIHGCCYVDKAVLAYRGFASIIHSDKKNHYMVFSFPKTLIKTEFLNYINTHINEDVLNIRYKLKDEVSVITEKYETDSKNDMQKYITKSDNKYKTNSEKLNLDVISELKKYENNIDKIDFLFSPANNNFDNIFKSTSPYLKKFKTRPPLIKVLSRSYNRISVLFWVFSEILKDAYTIGGNVNAQI